MQALEDLKYGLDLDICTYMLFALQVCRGWEMETCTTVDCTGHMSYTFTDTGMQ